MVCHQICYKTNNKFYISYVEKILSDYSLLNLYLDNLNKLDCKKTNSLEVNYLREAFTNICQYKSMISNK